MKDFEVSVGIMNGNASGRHMLYVYNSRKGNLVSQLMLTVMCDTIIKLLVKRNGVSTEHEEISWKISCLQWKECVMLPEVLVLCIVERVAISDTNNTMNMVEAGYDAEQEVRGGEG